MLDDLPVYHSCLIDLDLVYLYYCHVDENEKEELGFIQHILVRLGQVLLDFDIIDNWIKELDLMNKEDKIWELYTYAYSYLQLLGIYESIFSPIIQTDRRCSHHISCRKQSTIINSSLQYNTQKNKHTEYQF